MSNLRDNMNTTKQSQYMRIIWISLSIDIPIIPNVDKCPTLKYKSDRVDNPLSSECCPGPKHRGNRPNIT